MDRVIGVVQHYAWGDPVAIPELLGHRPDARPWAELWLGTHPGGPARTVDGRALSEVCGELPYLLKVLAAAEPLSLQTHPDAGQARSGFARDERAGRALDDPMRTYRDPFPKPEILCAMTPFEALCGFRPIGATLDLLDRIGATSLAATLDRDGLGATVRALYEGTLTIGPILDACAGNPLAEARLVDELARSYPGDPSVAVTLLLNRVRLAPGEAIFLGPGNVHAYLRGVGIEVMGASDNVLRAGLTVKHVDVDELLRVVSFDVLDEPRTVPVETAPGRWRYDTPDTPFRLWRFDVDGTQRHRATGRELVICTDGSTTTLGRGETVVLAAGDELVLEGRATIYRVEEIGTATAG